MCVCVSVCVCCSSFGMSVAVETPQLLKVRDVAEMIFASRLASWRYQLDRPANCNAWTAQKQFFRDIMA